jgi:integrase
MGSLYKQKGRDGQPGRIWWTSVYTNGRRQCASTETADATQARRILKQREGRVAAGLPLLPRADRVRYDEAAKDLRQHYTTTGDRDLVGVEGRLAHLDAFFSGRRLASIGGAEATAYVEHRQAKDAANSTINRELGVLIKMLRLAAEHNKLLRLPTIRKLKEAAPRSGFFEQAQYVAVRAKLPEDLQVAVTIEHTYGWRCQSEVLTLERRQLDLDAGTLRLDPGTTKNDDGRLVFLTPELKTMLAAQVARVKALERKLGAVVPYLFPNLTGGDPRTAHGPKRTILGARRQDFRRAWRTACARAGVPGRLRHDFRRTAVRNLVAFGVSERVAMTMTGHKTRSVFDRYHIVSSADLQEASRRLAGSGITPAITGPASGNGER